MERKLVEFKADALKERFDEQLNNYEFEKCRQLFNTLVDARFAPDHIASKIISTVEEKTIILLKTEFPTKRETVEGIVKRQFDIGYEQLETIKRIDLAECHHHVFRKMKPAQQKSKSLRGQGWWYCTRCPKIVQST